MGFEQGAPACVVLHVCYEESLSADILQLKPECIQRAFQGDAEVKSRFRGKVVPLWKRVYPGKCRKFE
jgi:hypothetical protein